MTDESLLSIRVHPQQRFHRANTAVWGARVNAVLHFGGIALVIYF